MGCIHSGVDFQDQSGSLNQRAAQLRRHRTHRTTDFHQLSQEYHAHGCSSTNRHTNNINLSLSAIVTTKNRCIFISCFRYLCSEQNKIDVIVSLICLFNRVQILIFCQSLTTQGWNRLSS